MKTIVRRKLKTDTIKIFVDRNASVEFDDYNEAFNKRIIVGNEEYRLSRDTYTLSQLRSIRMLEKLNAYFLIYL